MIEEIHWGKYYEVVHHFVVLVRRRLFRRTSIICLKILYRKHVRPYKWFISFHFIGSFGSVKELLLVGVLESDLEIA